MIREALGVGLAYLAGSIPFGLLLSLLLRGEDLRRKGSGNIGATNALRTGGVGLGVATLLLDGAKGVAGYLAGGWLLRSVGTVGGGWETALLLAPVVGHCYPLWLRFRGGKGVATALGVLAVAEPRLLPVSAVCFLALALPSGYVSLGSLGAAAAAAAAAFWLLGPAGTSWGVLALAAVIFLRHRENISRLLAGTEARVGRRAAKKGKSGP
ncbi:MAG: glycerol-3-phosphate 1-O-acyltransferase PlsY [Acidobacteriota bacterium]|nr:glycerol-3-phosphate 1-O-acyltransferase PlsY [Acidobacteriota bacterium]